MRYHDPIAQAGRSTPSARRVDVLRGEDRLVGDVYEVKGWARWNDKQKVGYLRRLAEGYGDDPALRAVTAHVLQTRGCPPRNYPEQARHLLAWVQDTIYYTNESNEQIQSPWRTLHWKNGDCDDQAILLAAMCQSIALPWRFALAGTVRGRPARWVEGQSYPRGLKATHIYVVIGWPPFAPTTWASAEPTIRGLPLGHDVVRDGIPAWAHAGVDLPGARRSNMAGFGDATAAPTDPTANVLPAVVRAPPSGVAGLVARIDWNGLVQAVIEGTIVAIAVQYATRRLK